MREHTSPRWLALAKEKITEYELTGALFGLLIAQALFPGVPVLLCCDNQGADGTIIRGSNKTPIGRALSSVFWHAAAESGCAIWVEFARSGLNPSDPISRMCTLLLEKAAPLATDLIGVPNSFLTILNSSESLDSARFRPPLREHGFGPPFSCPNVTKGASLV